jgi:hypothetical protein
MTRLPMFGAMPAARSPARAPVPRRELVPLSAALLALALSACGTGLGSTRSAVPDATAGVGDATANPAADTQASLTLVTNGEGASATFTTAAGGVIDTSNAFFQPFGNGRACSSCHRPEDGWSITPDTLAERFASSDGLDPVFRTVDGANSPIAPVATREERAAAYSLRRRRLRGALRLVRLAPAHRRRPRRFRRRRASAFRR